MADDTPVLVYSTFPDTASARAAAGVLVRERLAACVNMIPGMKSVYVWKGNVEENTEIVFIAKTMQTRSDAVMATIRKYHPYDEPALIVLPTAGGAQSFCDWIEEQVAG
ncbi:divalent cation tolerance protein [Breoghania corrubedonensis]|uniref:Divalent cation tolerance protein n=1 Tax=Breoghania corrubedonensis TaxID=665038 RepID=A0A2T5VD14_9HYPH|nr:divalent-cation tolerance protein CutA [Breoghania corrubedonensis]PTW61625.1 divalent cation tolerance protein [Breoghania corrubedonensis]